MKCKCCGGEVAAEALSCPYCGAENPEGIRFQQEIQAKIKRNKLLAPILLRQKTPELVERILNRVMIGGVAWFVISLLICFGMFCVEYGIDFFRGEKVPHTEYAVILEDAHTANHRSGYDYWLEERNDMLDKLETGALISDYETENLIGVAQRFWDSYNEKDAVAQNGREEVEAFFCGILGFGEAELIAMMKSDWYRLSDEQQQEIAAPVKQRLVEVQQKWDF